MRRWQSHKIVEAGIITGLEWPTASGTPPTHAQVDGGALVDLPPDIFSRGGPLIGSDYLVRYADGYLSWSPKKAFEDGYIEVFANLSGGPVDATTERNKLIGVLLERLGELRPAADLGADYARIEELAYLLMTTVQGDIL